jgi:NAD(P)-dependent dehydrogenase (short-subunit alcohol dehydrogenase family)
MSMVAWFKGRGKSGFGYGSTAAEVVRGLSLKGRKVLITGCNSGIGLASVKALGDAGATLLAAARTAEKASEAAASIGVEAIPLACELSDPASVRACVAAARKHAPIDVLLLNAGIMALPEREMLFGYEKQFFTNHLGHFLLLTGLLDALAPDGRVVLVSSAAHRMSVRGGIDFDNLDGSKGYSAWRFYGHSKLANLLTARALAKRFEGSRRRAFAVHPGVIRTNLGRHMSAIARGTMAIADPLFLKSQEQGAATQVWAAVHPDAAAHNGAYLADCNVAKASKDGQDETLAERLWTESERIIAGLG